MGIQRWELRPEWRVSNQMSIAPVETVNKTISDDNQAACTPGSIATLGWTALEQCVVACQRCDLHLGRTHTVFGSGSHSAEWMIIGEGPGAEEDRQGVPFVGRAGKLLDNMIYAIGLRRQEVYIANAVKCRPPENRDPKPEELATCLPYLERQIELLNPRILLVLGRVAAQSLLQTKLPLAKLRGKVHHYASRRIPLVVTYHPAYLLRSPTQKRIAWKDLRLAKELLERGG